jgi:uncharacterized protein YndB with AHSA1/START domain
VDARNPDIAAETLVVQRVIDAPIERVFDAWLDADSLGRWLFATEGGEMVRVEVDPRVGGEFVVVEKRGDTLAEHYGKYIELDRPNRLVFEFSTDREQNPTRVTIKLRQVAGGCELTLSHQLDPKWAAFRERALCGWTGILTGLATTVGDERELFFTRLLNAPRELVFEAWTKPEHVAQWWGPSGFSTTTHEMRVETGGVWRFLMHGPDGIDYPNRVTFTDVEPPARIAYDHGDDNHPRHFRVLATFADEGRKTRLTMRMMFDSVEACQAVKRYGAVEGARQTLARLQEYVTRL